MPNKKIKFIGKQMFTGWIRPFLMFIAINVINITITYEIVDFISPLSTFMNNVNDIIDAENRLLQSYF